MEQLPDKNNDILKKLIKPELMVPPPVDFTAEVMGKLGIAPVKSALVYEPVISKKGWILILCITIVVFVITFSGYDSGVISETGFKSQLYIQQIEHTLATAFSGSVMIYIALLSAAVFLLFLGESVFRQARMKLVNS